MQFKQGTDIYTADNQKAGTVDRVAIDPKTQEVTHLITRRGFLFPEERVIPISLVGTTSEEQITLRENAADIEDMPPFEELHYVQVNPEGQPLESQPGDAGSAGEEKQSTPPVFWYPPVGMTWWHVPGYYSYPGQFGERIPPYIAVEKNQNIPEGTVPLEVDAHVISAEGEHVGDVEEVFTEPKANRVTHLLISRGLLFKETKLVPTSWITKVKEDEVHLVVGAAVLEALPEYPAPSE